MSTKKFKPTLLESSIDFEPITLTTQARQHLLERTIFNFINHVKVKWSI